MDEFAPDDINRSSIPLDIEGALNDASSVPSGVPVKGEYTEKPGWLSTFGYMARHTSDIGDLYDASTIEGFANVSGEIPDGWDPVKSSMGLYEKTDQKYWHILMNTKTPEQQQKAFQWIIERQKDDEYYYNGSFSAKLLGGLAGGVESLTTLIPIMSAAKYAKTSSTMFNAAFKAAPAVTAAAIADESVRYGIEHGEDLSENVRNVLINSIFGLSMVAGGAGLGRGFEGFKLYKVNKTFEATEAGVYAKPKINDKGEIIGVTASPLPNSSVGAAEVNKWQDFFESGLADGGLFQFGIATKAISKLNPKIKILTSDWATSRFIGNKVFDHSLDTGEIIAGKARGVTADELFEQIKNESREIQQQLRGFWQESNGITANNQITQAIKEFQVKNAKDGVIKPDEFFFRVRSVLLSGEQDSNKSINAAAKFVDDKLTEMYERWRKIEGFDESIIPPRTAANYLMRVYDKDSLVKREADWNRVISKALKDQDDKITSFNEPLELAQKQLQELYDLKSSMPHMAKEINAKIETQKQNVEIAKNVYENHLFNPDNNILLEKGNIFTKDQFKQLKSLNEQRDIISTPINNIKSEISNIKTQISRSKQLIKKAKSKDTVKKHTKKIKEQESLIARKENELDKAIKARISFDDDLINEQIAGKLHRNLFSKHPETGRLELRNANDFKPKFRKVYEDDLSRLEAAAGYRETILGHNAEQVQAAMLSHMTGGLSENPLKARSLMIKDTILHENRFLSNDLGYDVANYRATLGRRIVPKEIFPDLDFDAGKPAFGSLLAEERLKKEAALTKPYMDKLVNEQQKLINSLRKAASKDKSKLQEQLDKVNKQIEEGIPDLPELQKQRAALEKSFQKEKKLLTTLWNVMMGNVNAGKSERLMAQGIKSLTIATRLGAVPLTQVVDLAATVMKHGMWNTISRGLIPTIKASFQRTTGKSGQDVKNAMAHLHLGIEHELENMRYEIDNPTTVPSSAFHNFFGETPAETIANGLSKVAHISQNVAGTTYIDNFLQKVVTNINQSIIMENMFKFKAGKLSDKDYRAMLRFGIDPKKDADVFISQYKLANGEKGELNSYRSKFYDWQDSHAKNKMAIALKRSVRETILKGDRFDNPFMNAAQNSPITSLLFLFKSWGLTAFNRYTAPLLQRPDAKQMLGVLTMLTAGALVDPLRRMTRGEEPDLFGDDWYLGAIRDSGVLGIVTDIAEMANHLSGDSFYKGSDRYRDRGLMGTIGGPALGVLEDALKTARLPFKTQASITDAKRGMRLIPLLQTWYLRSNSNQMVESWGLPKQGRE